MCPEGSGKKQLARECCLWMWDWYTERVQGGFLRASGLFESRKWWDHLLDKRVD